MLTAWSIASVALAYVLGLFAIAYYVDRRARERDEPHRQPGHLLAVPGGVLHLLDVLRQRRTGRGLRHRDSCRSTSARRSWPLWWFVLRKTVRIAKTNNITSIADFLGSRYGQSTLLGGVVAVITVVGITPYIALQLKAISQSFDVLLRYPDVTTTLPASASRPFCADTAFGTAVLLIALLHHVRRARPRLLAPARGTGGHHRVRVAGEAACVSGGGRLRHLRGLRRLRRHLRARRPASRVRPPARRRPGVLVRRLAGPDLALDDGDHAPAAPVPHGRHRQHARVATSRPRCGCSPCTCCSSISSCCRSPSGAC